MKRSELVPGPVRKIGIKNFSIRGNMPEGPEYESSLERDFMELTRFDRNIKLYTAQPLIVDYVDAEGKARVYYPDAFIEYRRDIYPAREMPHVLCEIKYRSNFRQQWRELLPKFRAAKQFATERGWEFKVFTEKEIRTPYLKNVKFLWAYRERPRNAGIADLVLLHLSELRETDPEALMCSLFRDRWKRAEALPDLWYLIANHQVGCDLSEPLTMQTTIWTLEG